MYKPDKESEFSMKLKYLSYGQVENLHERIENLGIIIPATIAILQNIDAYIGYKIVSNETIRHRVYTKKGYWKKDNGN